MEVFVTAPDHQRATPHAQTPADAAVIEGRNIHMPWLTSVLVPRLRRGVGPSPPDRRASNKSRACKMHICARGPWFWGLDQAVPPVSDQCKRESKRACSTHGTRVDPRLGRNALGRICVQGAGQGHEGRVGRTRGPPLPPMSRLQTALRGGRVQEAYRQCRMRCEEDCDHRPLNKLA